MVDLRLRFALAPAWDKLAVKGKRMSLTDQLTNVADLKLNKRKGAFSVREPGPEDRAVDRNIFTNLGFLTALFFPCKQIWIIFKI